MNKKFLDLGYQPLANKYLKKYRKLSVYRKELYNLSVGFNTKTKLVSLLKKIPDKKMFDNTYPYTSSMSKTMISSFKKLKFRDYYYKNREFMNIKTYDQILDFPKI